MWYCQLTRDPSFHHRRIREDFGLLGVDIWLKPCQSIGWLSGIDRRAERPTCLFVFQSTGLCSMYSASVNQETPLAKHTVAVLVLLHACVFLIFAVSLPQLPADIVYFCLDSYIYFSELGATFTAAQLFSSMPVCDSPSVTHCWVDSLYNWLWLSTSLVWNMLVHVFFSAPHLTLVSSNHSPLLPNRLFPRWVSSLPSFQTLFHTKLIQNICGASPPICTSYCDVCWHTNQPNPLEFCPAPGLTSAGHCFWHRPS